MKLLTPYLPDSPDPIDERFALDPIEDITEEVLLSITKDLVALHRTEIEEWNKALLKAQKEGKKISGTSIRKTQKARLTKKQSALLEQAKNDSPIEDLI